MSNQPRQEHPSTYFVQDRSNQDELTRLLTQDQMITRGMGGVLPEQADPTQFQRILDVSCGTGGWLVEAAKTYPSISLLVGIDISSRMIEHARALTEAQQVSDRVHFQTMDAQRMLEFPREYFDLVNLRFGSGYLRTWDWPKMLQEMQRVTKPGGIIRLTDVNRISGNGPALQQFQGFLSQAFSNAGHSFSPDGTGIGDEMARLLRQYGIENVQTQAHQLTFPSGTEEGQSFYDNVKYVSQTALPFLRKWTRVPDDYDTIRQQMLVEMQQPDFVGHWDLTTAWGNKSLN